jgi:TolA-binding protein
MIAQVEENLAKTTQRAQQAEAQIEHLKLELANSRIANLRGDDNIVHSAEHLKLRLLEARDKAKVASSSLMKAATDAEGSIRDLLKGVDTLRTVSGILSAIDKLTIIESNL